MNTPIYWINLFNGIQMSTNQILACAKIIALRILKFKVEHDFNLWCAGYTKYSRAELGNGCVFVWFERPWIGGEENFMTLDSNDLGRSDDDNVDHYLAYAWDLALDEDRSRIEKKLKEREDKEKKDKETYETLKVKFEPCQPAIDALNELHGGILF